MRVVLDTNIIVSALIAPSGKPAAIIDAWLDGKFTLLTCAAHVDELRATLQKPYHSFHRVPAQLLQRRDALVAVDDDVTVRLIFDRHHHYGRLLPTVGQRSQQSPLPRRVAHAQMLPTPVELMKLQLHRTG